MSLHALRRLPFAALLITGLWLSPAHADPDASGDDAGSHWGVGIGGGTERSPYKGVKNRNVVLPLLSYKNRWLHVFGNQVDLKLPSAGALEFALRAKYALDEGYKAADLPALAGMAERKSGIRLGATASWRNPIAVVSLEWLADASGHSKGNSISFGVEHAYALGGHLALTPHVVVTRLDRKEVDYFYGVSAMEATALRPAYKGGATSVVEAGLRFSHAGPDSPHTFFLDAGFKRWGPAITGSPLVDRKSSPTVRAGYLYRL